MNLKEEAYRVYREACFKHHREHHKEIFENPELLTK